MVEDSPALRQLMERILGQHGHRGSTATDGARGLELIRQELPDLVITDWQLPGLSGTELIQTLAASPTTRSIPVLLVSANVAQAEAASGPSARARVYLPKPFRRQAFLDAVDRVLQEPLTE